MRRWVMAFAAMVLAPGILGGQIIPGVKPPNRSAIHEEFLDAVIHGVRETATKWATAWRKDDARKAADLYEEDAFIITPEGNEVRGRDSIAAYLKRTLATTGALQTYLLDVDASDRMAMTLDQFVLPEEAAGQPAMEGLLLTIYKSDGWTWRIRSQVFRPEPEKGSS